MNKEFIEDKPFKGVNFLQKALTVANYENCNKFLLSLNFENCLLKLSSFYQVNIKKTYFMECNIQEVDFVEADLTNAVFSNSGLTNAIFEKTNLEQADFRTSYGLIINPENNRMKKARFSASALNGLLTKYDILIE